MLSLQNIFDTIDMIDKQHLDIRTITMGISLLDCVSEDADRCCRKIYDKICRRAQNLVATGQTIEKEFGIPIVNKRVSVTPISLVASAIMRVAMYEMLYMADIPAGVAINEAVEEAKEQGIHGKATTPFLLAKIKDITGGSSLAANIQLVYNNAKLAAATAVELSKLAKN